MRRAAKTDANQAMIVGALRACGARVLSLAAVGKGCPDLLVGHRGKLYLMECKDGTKPPSARELTPDQIDFHMDWYGLPIHVVNSADEAVATLVE